MDLPYTKRTISIYPSISVSIYLSIYLDLDLDLDLPITSIYFLSIHPSIHPSNPHPPQNAVARPILIDVNTDKLPFVNCTWSRHPIAPGLSTMIQLTATKRVPGSAVGYVPITVTYAEVEMMRSYELTVAPNELEDDDEYQETWVFWGGGGVGAMFACKRDLSI